MSWGCGTTTQQQSLGRHGRTILTDLSMPVQHLANGEIAGPEYFAQMPQWIVRRIISHYYAMRREAWRALILVTTAPMFNKRNGITNSEILDIKRLLVIEPWRVNMDQLYEYAFAWVYGYIGTHTHTHTGGWWSTTLSISHLPVFRI